VKRAERETQVTKIADLVNCGCSNAEILPQVASLSRVDFIDLIRHLLEHPPCACKTQKKSAAECMRDAAAEDMGLA